MINTLSIPRAGRGEIGAKLTAELCNQIHPTLIGANMLTIYPASSSVLRLISVILANEPIDFTDGRYLRISSAIAVNLS